MASLYTPAEANVLYNKCKIAWDPTSYSLKDGLKLTYTVAELAKKHISNIGFNAESQLAAVIFEFFKVDGKAYLKSKFDTSKKAPNWGASYGVTRNDAVFCKSNDMCIGLDYLKTYFSDHQLKEGGLLEAIVQTLVALSSTKSCCADLHWTGVEGTDSSSYMDLHTFAGLAKALETKADYLPVYVDKTYSLHQMSIAPDTLPAAGVLLTGGIPAATKTDIEVVASQMYYTLMFGMEVLWAIQSLPDAKMKALMQVYTTTGYAIAHSHFSDYLFKQSGHDLIIQPDVLSLIHISNPKERFEAYREYAKKMDFEAIARAHATDFKAEKLSATVPMGFGTLVGFAQTYSTCWVRLNHCRILYEFAMQNNLLEETDDDTVRDGIDALEISTGSDPTTFSTKVEKTNSDLMDLSVGHKHTDGKATSAVDKYTAPTYEALDKAKSKYVDGKYTFETKDVTDFSDGARKKYEAIAKKVSLVNRVLTQKLRDIKTYNTGGKQPGLASGRVDRKAVYRYRYDPNIFYNNTYKQLESDLAFGVILDISGSMYGKGIENGRITMIVLHETLKSLGINHSIIGHTSNGRYHCKIERYQSFREDGTYQTRKNYALAELDAHNGNCDSASLYYMEKALLRAKNRDKVCVIFSDGQPTECTGTDLREQVAHMEKNGIKVIGIGIDFPEIADYYKDYANGKNLSDMLTIVTNILKEYILKKKERA